MFKQDRANIEVRGVKKPSSGLSFHRNEFVLARRASRPACLLPDGFSKAQDALTDLTNTGPTVLFQASSCRLVMPFTRSTKSLTVLLVKSKVKW